MDIPKELIGYVITFFNKKTLFNAAFVNKFFYEESHWLRLCFTDKKCQLLTQDGVIAEQLIARTINPQWFYKAVQDQNIVQLEKMLFTEPVRRWTLYIAVYDSRIPTGFPKSTLARQLYLSEEIGKQELPNARRVKHWVPVSIMVNVKDFACLFTNHYIEYASSISSSEMIHPNIPMELNVSPRATS